MFSHLLLVPTVCNPQNNRPDGAFPVCLQHFFRFRQEGLGLANLVVVFTHHRLLLRTNEHPGLGKASAKDGGKYRQTGADPIQSAPAMNRLRDNCQVDHRREQVAL